MLHNSFLCENRQLLPNTLRLFLRFKEEIREIWAEQDTIEKKKTKMTALAFVKMFSTLHFEDKPFHYKDKKKKKKKKKEREKKGRLQFFRFCQTLPFLFLFSFPFDINFLWKKKKGQIAVPVVTATPLWQCYSAMSWKKKTFFIFLFLIIFLFFLSFFLRSFATKKKHQNKCLE